MRPAHLHQLASGQIPEDKTGSFIGKKGANIKRYFGSKFRVNVRNGEVVVFGPSGSKEEAKKCLACAINAVNPKPVEMKNETIIIDGYNYMSVFFPPSDFRRLSVGALFAHGKSKIEDLKEAFHKQGIIAHFVFDNGQQSEEAKQKWVKRRLREVEMESRDIPAGCGTAYRTFLEDMGFEIYRPPGIDGDDAVAKLAQMMDASILSRDKDMTRYGLPLDKIYTDFVFEDGEVKFVKRVPSFRALNLERRSLDSIPAPNNLAEWKWKAMEPSKREIFQRGNQDGFTKAYGNLYEILRPLRLAMYTRQGLDSMVERMPVWRDGKAKIEEVTVVPSAEYDYLLNDACKAFQWTLERCGSAENRKHSCAMTVAELVTEANPEAKQRTMDLYQELMNS